MIKYKQYSPLQLDTKQYPHLQFVTKCWKATTDQPAPTVYHILQDTMNNFKHLRITREDEQPGHDFMHFQEIKNDLWGKDTIAVEIYPAQKDLRNNRNTYHLWTWKNMEVPNLTKLYYYPKPNKSEHSSPPLTNSNEAEVLHD